ncbi:hypothetical protein TREVI0001_1418 [Treponema vincentii ATCC 35580]|uniref:Uncharacterized protein n=1 Tax=Treponema vincentii ATCC 35580 TaxID=596324 RepID=C8PPV7_9SPIR|nr:hypothetical protein TREVI0001_1418 [Treponema vincentii ATCC 35580]
MYKAVELLKNSDVSITQMPVRSAITAIGICKLRLKMLWG